MLQELVTAKDRKQLLVIEANFIHSDSLKEEKTVALDV